MLYEEDMAAISRHLADEVEKRLAERLEVLSRAEESREVMNAEEAADFLRIPYQNFRRIASQLPRHRVTDRRYVYYRSELVEWLLSR